MTADLDKYIERIELLVRSKVGQLRRDGYITNSERDDVSQELLLHVIAQWPELDESKFTPLGYAKLVIDQKTSNVLRKLYSMREIGNRQHGPITEAIANQVSGPAESSTLTLTDLTPEEFELAERVAELGPKRAAKQLGLTQAEFKRKRMAIVRQIQNTSKH